MKVMDRKAVIGRVFEIERYAINDGPGIRTLVFLKGCNLRCVWCSNPESQNHLPQLVYYKKKCLGCGNCVSVCESDALSLTHGGIEMRRDLCNRCGECASICNAQALVLLGRTMTTEEVLAEVLKDEPFYRKSGGGVTFSGGEPMEQSDFLLSAAMLCKENNINTAVETCGSVAWEIFEKVMPAIDLFLYDIKEMDPERHSEYTGVPNGLILENFVRLAESGKRIVVRIPVVPGHNDRDDNIEKIIDFLHENVPGTRVDLLAYHRLGKTKYARLGLRYALGAVDPPPPSRMWELERCFTCAGFKVSMGG